MKITGKKCPCHPCFLVLKVREITQRLRESNSNLEEIHYTLACGVGLHSTLLFIPPFYIFLEIMFDVLIRSSLSALPFSYLSSFPPSLLLARRILDFL